MQEQAIKEKVKESYGKIALIGLNERILVIKCYPGSPDYDISEVVTPVGDDEYKTQLDELVDFRKSLLVFRLLHLNDSRPNIVLNLKNRNKQLCKPIIRLFQGTKAVGDIRVVVETN